MNKIYNTLYTKDSIGNTRIWYMEQNGPKYRTVTGINGSDNLVTSEWTVAEPKNTGKKNETSAVEQAALEIEAKYKKQLKTGYHEDINDIDEGTSYIEAMLAKNYNDYSDKIKFESAEWGVQTKFNGFRCIASKDGLYSRKGEKFISTIHIEESLKPFFDKYPNAVLDGELFNEDLREKLSEISKLVRKTKHVTEEDFNKSKEIIKYYVYDGYGFNSNTEEDAPYESRKNWIDYNVTGQYKYIESVVTVILRSEGDLNTVYENLVEQGHEGAILRKMNMPYEHKRTKNLLKVKPEMDDECVILSIHEGNGNWSGTAKTATVKWKGKEFDSTFKGTQEELKEVLKNKSNWIGKKVTMNFNSVTSYGVPNFSRIDVNNCFKH